MRERFLFDWVAEDCGVESEHFCRLKSRETHVQVSQAYSKSKRAPPGPAGSVIDPLPPPRSSLRASEDRLIAALASLYSPARPDLGPVAAMPAWWACLGSGCAIATQS